MRAYPCVMLLEADWDQWEYRVMRSKVLALQAKHDLDRQIFEDASSGKALLSDLKYAGKNDHKVYAWGFPPKEFGDKSQRLWVASGAFNSGLVFYDASNEKLTQVIDHVAKFPAGKPPCKDVSDTVSQAIITMQRGWYLRNPDDLDDPKEQDDDDFFSDVFENEQPEQTRGFYDG